MWNPTTMELMPGFWPPKPSAFWNFLLRPCRWYYLRKMYQIADVQITGREHVDAVADEDGLLIAPNHSHDSDPHVMMHVSRMLGKQFYFMAAWQVFLGHKGIDGFVMQRFGAFSVDREGCDRRAMREAMGLLSRGKTLVVFPEGEIYHTAERLTPLREGVAFMAITAQRDLSKENSPRKIRVIPTAIHYTYVDDITSALEASITRMERNIAIKSKSGTPLHERIIRFGEALLTLKEREKLGTVQSGDLPARLTSFIEQLLAQLETRHFEKTSNGDSVPLRVKTLRHSLLETMCDEKADESARRIAHDDLDDLHLVLQLYSYPGDYLSTQPSVERMAETIEKFEEDLQGVASPKGKRIATVKFSEAIDVKPFAQGRARTAAGELTSQLEQRIKGLMLQT
jgi:1-acyl-sn-glycerol-3-phosphate acyltransferase